MKAAWPDAHESARLDVDLAGIVVRIETRDARLAAVLDVRFASFATDRAPVIDIAFAAHRPLPRDLVSPTGVRSEPHELAPTARGFRVRGATFEVEADLDAGMVEVGGPPAAYPLDIALRYLLPLLFADGLVVHGAALAGPGLGFLCAGPSGSGKSTLAELLPEQALCDEQAVVVRGHCGWELRSLPFWRSRPGRAPLTAVALLRHAARSTWSRLDSAEACRRLATHVSWPVARPSAIPATLDTLAQLVSDVPVGDLAFRPTVDVWDTLAQGGTR